MNFKGLIEAALAQADYSDAARLGMAWCETEPQLALARNMTGIALMQSGDLPAAIASFTEATRIDSDYARAWHNLGVALMHADQAIDALSALRQAFLLAPEDASISFQLAELLTTIGDYVGARDVLTKALNSNLKNPHLFLKLGVVANLQGDKAAAKEAIQMAIALDPDCYEAHNELGVLMYREGNDAEAERCYRVALKLNAHYADALNNLGDIYFSQLRFEDAERCFRHAINISPDLASAHFNLGLLLLTRGEFQTGWQEYRWRLKIPEVRHKVRHLIRPEWQGESLVGMRLFVHAEQGFGDNIQFVRYMSMLKSQGATVIFETPKELTRLFRTAKGIDTLVDRGWPVPDHDFHIPVMGIPEFFRTTLENIPNQTPYLKADEAESREWSIRLGSSDKRLRVGIVCTGSPNHQNDRNRSIPIQELKRLEMVEGVRWISLNKSLPNKTKLETVFAWDDWTHELADFAATAALIDNLDLVISVDTAVAHLAGALGTPVWVLLPYAAEWRWLHVRTDSPWYPTARLFRQSVAGDWGSVMDDLRECLYLYLQEKRASQDAL